MINKLNLYDLYRHYDDYHDIYYRSSSSRSGNLRYFSLKGLINLNVVEKEFIIQKL